MKRLAEKFVLRWFVSGLGLWIATAILSNHGMELGVSGTKTWVAATIAGFFLAVVNMFVKPLLIILSFPAIILSLGLFMLVLNGLTILIVSVLYGSLIVPNIGVAIVAGVVVGLVNYLVSRIVKEV